MAHGVAVHRAVVEWLQWNRRHQVPFKDAAVRAGERDKFDGQAVPLRFAGDDRHGFVEAQAGRE